MGLDSIVNEYSLIHYKQQNELKEGSLQERLVVVVGPDGHKNLDIRTLSLWERIQALFDYGPAAKSAVIACINESPQKEALLEKVAFIFDELVSSPRRAVVLSAVSQCHNRSLLGELVEKPDIQEHLNDKVAGDDTALMLAIKNSNKDAFKVLVHADGIDLNVWNLEQEYTPLILAIQEDKIEFVKELIARDCQIPVKAFLEAKKHPQMLAAIKNASALQKSELLVDAVEKNNDAALKKILNDIHGIDMIPALAHAIHNEKADMVDKLVGHGIELDKVVQVAVQDWAKGGIALSSTLFQNLVALHPSLSCLAELPPEGSLRTKDEYKELLSMLAFDQSSEESYRALKRAQERGNWSLVQALLECGVNANYEPDGASRMLLRAASRAGPEVVSLLLEQKADPAYKDSRGNSALKRAELRLSHGRIPGDREQAQAVLSLLQGFVG